jgi:hypothetical protein
MAATSPFKKTGKFSHIYSLHISFSADADKKGAQAAAEKVEQAAQVVEQKTADEAPETKAAGAAKKIIDSVAEMILRMRNWIGKYFGCC